MSPLAARVYTGSGLKRGMSRLCQIRNAEGIMSCKGALEQRYDFQIGQMAYHNLTDAIPTAWRNNNCNKKDNIQNKYIVGDFVFAIRKLTNGMVYENLLNRICKTPQLLKSGKICIHSSVIISGKKSSRYQTEHKKILKYTHFSTKL